MKRRRKFIPVMFNPFLWGTSSTLTTTTLAPGERWGISDSSSSDSGQRAARVLRSLHREDGPALYMERNKSLYFWHGINVPEWVIMEPESINLKDIMETENLELRRILIERYGQGRFIADIGGEKKHQDKFGILWLVKRENMPKKLTDLDRLNLEDVLDDIFGKNKTTQFVQVKDSSTPRVYFIQVPTFIKTAREGVAWSFGKKEKEYNPKKET